MSNQRLIELIKRVHAKTVDGSIKWESTSNENIFLSTLGNYTITLMSHNQDIWFRIFRTDELVESVSDVQLKSEWPEAYTTMSSLYVDARRSAKGVDKAIDELLGNLKDVE